MKSKTFTTLTIATLFAICLIKQSKAQEIPKDISERITNATYIFEGKVIRVNSYWTADLGYIYTSSTIEIHKIFKGAIDCGTVEVITEGGTVGDKTLSISHNLILKKGMKGIFLTNTTQHELPSTDFYPETDSMKLDIPYDLQGYIKYFDDGINFSVSDWQFQLDSLVQVYNLIDLYTQLNYVDCGIGPIMRVQEHKLKQTPKPLNLIPHNPNNPQKKSQFSFTPKIKVQQQTTTGIYNLSYYLLNPQQTHSGSNANFEFDIGIGDDIDTATFLSATILLEYDTSIFGMNVANQGFMNVTNIGFAADPNSYSPPTWFDDPSADNLLGINLVQLGSPTQQLVNITNSPNPALHVVLPMINCDNISTIQFLDPFSSYPFNQGFEYQSGGFPQDDFYDGVILSAPLTVPGCTLVIDNITPDTVNGGINDIVTISGFKFGNSRGNGNVFLPNADDGGQTWLALDSTDYIDWTDTLILFTMPGVIDSNNLFNTLNRFGVPGTGIVRVENDLGDTASYTAKPLIVFYSIKSQTRNPFGSLAKFPDDYLGYNNNSTRGGYTFRADTSFGNYTDRMGCLRTAIHDWQCLSHANFILGDTIQSKYPTAHNDSLNIIQFGTDPSPTAVARTYIFSAFAAGFCQRELVENVDIIINRDKIDSLFIDSLQCDSLPFLKYDLYDNLLHELGHAHSLNHVNDPDRTMWFRAKKGVFPYTVSGLRKVYLLYDLSCKEGANYIMTRARDTTIYTVCGYNLMQTLTVTDCDTNIIAHRSSTFGCVPTVGINEFSQQKINLRCYPNPSNSKINIEYSLDLESNLTIKIFDNFGRQINCLNKPNESWGNHSYQINTSKFANGIYFVQVLTNEKCFSTKFIKE